MGSFNDVSFGGRVEVPKHVLVRYLERESVLLNLDTEVYYGLDEVGTRMWQLLIASQNIENAYEQLVAEFDVQAETLRQDLSELLEQLAKNNLLRIRPADPQ